MRDAPCPAAPAPAGAEHEFPARAAAACRLSARGQEAHALYRHPSVLVQTRTQAPLPIPLHAPFPTPPFEATPETRLTLVRQPLPAPKMARATDALAPSGIEFCARPAGGPQTFLGGVFSIVCSILSLFSSGRPAGWGGGGFRGVRAGEGPQPRAGAEPRSLARAACRAIRRVGGGACARRRCTPPRLVFRAQVLDGWPRGPRLGRADQH